jgi:hypothetical protein
MKHNNRLHRALDLLALALAAGGLYALWWTLRALSRLGETIGAGFAEHLHEQLPM